MEKEIKDLEGKTIKSIDFPDSLIFNKDYGAIGRTDDNIVITFTDGTVLKLGSWDYEGYSSGIDKEIIKSNLLK